MKLKDMNCLDCKQVVAQVYVTQKKRQKNIQSYVLCVECASKRQQLKEGVTVEPINQSQSELLHDDGG